MVSEFLPLKCPRSIVYDGSASNLLCWKILQSLIEYGTRQGRFSVSGHFSSEFGFCINPARNSGIHFNAATHYSFFTNCTSATISTVSNREKFFKPQYWRGSISFPRSIIDSVIMQKKYVGEERLMDNLYRTLPFICSLVVSNKIQHS